VDVYICKVRKKLAVHGIDIETAWGHGYFLTDDAKAKLRELMAPA
jgi:DNA-binding response OmpR family regulator